MAMMLEDLGCKVLTATASQPQSSFGVWWTQRRAGLYRLAEGVRSSRLKECNGEDDRAVLSWGPAELQLRFLVTAASSNAQHAWSRFCTPRPSMEIHVAIKSTSHSWQ